MKWINALGLLLQFIAFWFAAPELIGEANLKRLKTGLIRFTTFLPLLFFILLILGYGGYFAIGGAIKGWQASASGTTESEIYTFYVYLALATVIYLLVMFNFKKIKFWLNERLSKPLVARLIANDQFRSSLLLIGAILFTAGFLLQFGVLILQ